MTMGWTVVPRKTESGTWVDAEDAVCVLKAVLGKETLTRQGEFASDVTGDGSVTTLDAARILQFSLDPLERLPVAARCDSDWAFFPVNTRKANQETIDPLVDPNSCRSGKIVIDPLSETAGGQDFVGVLFGDCDGSWLPPGAQGMGASALTAPASAPPQLRLGSPRRLYPDRVRVPIYVSGANFSTFRLRVRYDARRLRANGIRATQRTGLLAVANTRVPGEILVAAASADRIPSSRAAVAVLEFTLRGGTGTVRPPRLVEASLDRQPALPARAARR